MTPTPGARHFHEELAKLRGRVLEMSGMVEELLRHAIEALRTRDLAAATAVILGDREVDALEVEIEEACVNLLALHQPMARDLRLITITMRIAHDLERVGDHAVNIARAVESVADHPPIRSVPQITEMARDATGMLNDALDHFLRGDAQGAREVCARDDRVDTAYDALVRILLTYMIEDPRRIGAAMSLILVCGDIERVGDLATNIAEDVVFLVEGRSIRHAEADGLRPRPAAE